MKTKRNKPRKLKAKNSCSVSLWADGNHPAAEGHQNLRRFHGVLTLLDVPSDKAPSGARGHRVILTKAAAQAALPSLLGMAVAYKVGWDGHDSRQKCGFITAAAIIENEVHVTGYIYARDFPEVVQKMETSGEDEFGMSYEMAGATVPDMRQDVWTLDSCTFTGAAILTKDKAAYKGTSFTLSGAGKRAKEKVESPSTPWYVSLCAGVTE